jgi:hypothetical protein
MSTPDNPLTKRCGLEPGFHARGKSAVSELEMSQKAGCWGERIRTSDWLIQSQLPYHLATPQRRSHSLPEASSDALSARPWREFSAGLASGTGVYTETDGPA